MLAQILPPYVATFASVLDILVVRTFDENFGMQYKSLLRLELQTLN